MLNQRKIALDALLAVDKNFGYSNLVLSDIFKNNDVPQADRSFITALFYGVLDRRITLDYIISKFTSKPIKRIKPITLNSLRIALYQILYMKKVPESAAVNESVKLVKASKESYNAAFINAVLRNFLRNGIDLPDDNSVSSLEIRYSCPAWIIESFINDYGIDNAIRILEHSLSEPKTTLRINPLLISDDDFISRLKNSGISASLNRIPHAAVLEEGIDITVLPEYKEGLFHIEDLPSQIAVTKLALKAGESLLDLCAAPGGKTFTAAQDANNAAKITACDVFEHRVNLIKSGAKRLKLDNITAIQDDSTVFDKTLGKFDAVICDVPCSGLGVIRRKPEIKYKENLDIKELEAIQRKILINASGYLKPGGRLLYSTCTLRTGENEQIVRDFLSINNSITLEYEHTFLPNIDGTDGFYFALLKNR
ncbi:MAG: 16S rRNA (cytosine(967)-C(5))-methyltransferase RsmB [Clostridia bacterium]|nr:16S rRNA (cytosine(967)-C(5))-methyltransferase RsmB [Clostridia bacterium]